MSGQPTPGGAPTAPSDPVAPQATGAELCRQVTEELLRIDMDVARLIQKRTNEETPCLPPPDGGRIVANLATSYERVARAVRHGVLLRQHLDKPIPAAKPEPTPTPTPDQQRTAARRRILRAVEDGIVRDCKQPGEAGRLRVELLERLDGIDVEHDIAGRPIPEIIAEIRRDLGLDNRPGMPPFPRRTPADIARLNEIATKLPQTETAAKPPPTPDPPADQIDPAHLDPLKLSDAELSRLLAATEPIQPTQRAR